MIIIPGFLVAWLTFPGIIVHEFAHALFCRLTRTKVHEVCYFRFGNPAGFVRHDPPTSVWKQLLIAGGPFIINSIAGFVIGLLAFKFIMPHKDWSVLRFIAGWLTVAVGMHAFPSRPDAVSVWQALWGKDAGKVPVAARIVGTPIAAIMYLGALFAVAMVDVVYGAVVGLLIPYLILK